MLRGGKTILREKKRSTNSGNLMKKPDQLKRREWLTSKRLRLSMTRGQLLLPLRPLAPQPPRLMKTTPPLQCLITMKLRNRDLKRLRTMLRKLRPRKRPWSLPLRSLPEIRPRGTPPPMLSSQPRRQQKRTGNNNSEVNSLRESSNGKQSDFTQQVIFLKIISKRSRMIMRMHKVNSSLIKKFLET